MERKMVCLLGIFLFVVMVSGCIGEDTTQPPGDTQPQCQSPKKMIGDVCCFDENDNGVCDMDEAGCPVSCDDGDPCTNDTCSASTDFKCVRETLYPCCGNGVCETDENVNNICPEDCEILNMTDFQYDGTPDYIEDGTFVFIHTTATETDYRLFYLNITAGDDGMENIRYTFKCNSTQHVDLDSIDSVPENISEEVKPVINKLDDDHYLIYSYFFLRRSPAYRLDDEKAHFHFKINKHEPQKRDELSCLFKFYFMQPHKLVYRWLKISYI